MLEKVLKMWICVIILGILLLKASVGKDCENSFPSDCQEVLANGHNTSGVYYIAPIGTYGGFQVFCDMETVGGGWLVFQRRLDGSVDFHKDWKDYRNGFGEVSGEHWLGTQALYAILNQGYYELRIELEDWEGNTTYANYAYFRLGDTITGFQLQVAEYTGTAGDSMTIQRSRAFSTKDITYTTCSKINYGGWWHLRTSCTDSDLNGPYLLIDSEGTFTSDGDGVVWHTWRGRNYSLKKTEMKLRRIRK